MQGQLLTAARPYLQLFSLLTLTLPPSSFGTARHSLRSKLILSSFVCYACCVLFIAFYTTYVNIVTLDWEVNLLQVEDFTNALGLVQKVAYSLMLLTGHASLILQYPRMAAIYVEISALEADIAAGTKRHGAQRQRHSFRRRLAMRIGLWIILVCIFFPRLTIPALRGMTMRDKLITEFILIVLQFKCFEYTLFVIIVQELLLRLRCILLQLQQQLAACEEKLLLQVLCHDLRQNKQLLGRIWKLVGELETYFMLPMLLMFLYNGITVLHLVNWAYIQSVNPYDCCRYWRIGTLSNQLTNVLIPCWISHNCISTYNSFKRILHDIRCGFGRSTPQLLGMVLMEYGLQLNHLTLRFTCGGFFEINLVSFGGMLVTIVSYIIILIQFKLQGLMETKHANSKLSNTSGNMKSSSKA